MRAIVISTLGPSMKTVFRSRWRAVWWSAGVLLTAYCSVPSQDDDDANVAPSAQVTPHHTNPWAKGSAVK
jgi:hypothetical protein